MAIGDIYKLACVWRYTSTPELNYAVNTSHYTVVVEGVPPSSPTDVITKFIADRQTQYRGCVSSKATLERYEARMIKPILGEPILVPSGIAGTFASTQTTPFQCSAVVLRTKVGPTNRTRGRLYLPFLPEEGQEDGVINDAMYDAINLYTAKMLNTMPSPLVPGATTYREVIYSRRNGTGVEVSIVLIGQRVATQKRRRRRFS